MPKLFISLAFVLLGLAVYLFNTDGSPGPAWACVSSGLMCITVGAANQRK